MLGTSRAATQENPSDLSSSLGRRRVLQAYIYGYAPMAVWATKRINTAVPEDNSHGKAPINQFSYIEMLANATETTVIRPNADTIYTPAFLNLRRQPMVLGLPAVRDRYYVVPLLDAYSNQFGSLGSRTTGSSAGRYLIAGPDWFGIVPEGITDVIRSPTPTVWILPRTLVRGPDDLSDAVADISRYRLIPLNRYGTRYTPPTDVPFREPEPDFVPPPGQPATAAPGFRSSEFFPAMQRFILANPPPSDQAELVASFAPVFSHPEALTPDIVNLALAEMQAALEGAGTSINNWGFSLEIGSYGENYALRAAIAATGLGGIVKEDAVYANCSTDANGVQLDGSRNYTIRFPAGRQPPVNGFWSVTVYNQSVLFVPNSINRYAVGSETGLMPEADGSVTIHLRNSPPPPSVPQPNWLPIPADGPFSLTLRMYWPKKRILNGIYQIPAVEVAG